MVDPDLLAILVCPETKLPVTLADEHLINELNQKIEQGLLLKKTGEKIEKSLTAGLLREDGQVLYPIHEDIPVMLIDEAIHLSSENTN